MIRSETVTGPVTGLALAAVHKFLAYGLLHGGQPNVANAVESLADAVTHARWAGGGGGGDTTVKEVCNCMQFLMIRFVSRFVGVDPSSDEIVLMKIMEVLRTLMLSPVGLLLTNESICEIMQSTFRICFENRLSELLRKTAEHALNDMIQLLFTRSGWQKKNMKHRQGSYLKKIRTVPNFSPLGCPTFPRRIFPC